jgi:hypothetical protein
MKAYYAPETIREMQRAEDQPAPIVKSDPFPADELPTRPGPTSVRGKAVLRRWSALPLDDQRFIEYQIDYIERRNERNARTKRGR